MHDTAPPAAPAPAPATTPARHDFYSAIHKALRHFMLDTLMRVGSLEVRDEAEVDAVLGALETLLDTCGQHLLHENTFVHPALEARRPGASERIAGEHGEHLEAIDALREDARQVRAASPGRRDALALRLYRHLALFVADNFHHMHHEETVHNATLWACYSDAELEALHGRLLASLPPQEVFLVMRWMIPALSPGERAVVLAGMRERAPEAAFRALVGHVRPHLDDTAWARLAPEIGLGSGAMLA
jgi:hypothetical protein